MDLPGIPAPLQGQRLGVGCGGAGTPRMAEHSLHDWAFCRCWHPRKQPGQGDKLETNMFLINELNNLSVLLARTPTMAKT